MTDSAHDKFGIYDRTTVDLDLDTLTVSWTDSFCRDHERQFAPGSPSDLELGRREIERHPVEHVLGELAAHVESRDTDFISVGINGCDDFFLLEVPAGSDKDTIITAIEAENARIGGDIKDYDDAFAPANSVRVYRNGISIIEQEAQPNPFDDADVWNAEGKRIQSAA